MFAAFRPVSCMMCFGAGYFFGCFYMVRVYCGQASSAPDRAAGTKVPADTEAGECSATAHTQGPRMKVTPTKEELRPGYLDGAGEPRRGAGSSDGFGEISGLYDSSSEDSKAPGPEPVAAVPNLREGKPVKKSLEAALREQLIAFLLAQPTFDKFTAEDFADSDETGASPLLTTQVLSRDDLAVMLAERAGDARYAKCMEAVRRADRDLATAILVLADRVAKEVGSEQGHTSLAPIWSSVPLNWDLDPKPGGWLNGRAEIGDGALRPLQFVQGHVDAPRYCFHLTEQGLYMAYPLLRSDEERLTVARRDLIFTHRPPAPASPAGTQAGSSMPEFETPGVRAVPTAAPSGSRAGPSRRLFPPVLPGDSEMETVVAAMLDHYRPFQGKGLERLTTYKLFGTSISQQSNVLTLHGAMVRSYPMSACPHLI